jgi:hypothetical protein
MLTTSTVFRATHITSEQWVVCALQSISGSCEVVCTCMQDDYAHRHCLVQIFNTKLPLNFISFGVAACRLADTTSYIYASILCTLCKERSANAYVKLYISFRCVYILHKVCTKQTHLKFISEHYLKWLWDMFRKYNFPLDMFSISRCIMFCYNRLLGNELGSYVCMYAWIYTEKLLNSHKFTNSYARLLQDVFSHVAPYKFFVWSRIAWHTARFHVRNMKIRTRESMNNTVLKRNSWGRDKSKQKKINYR